MSAEMKDALSADATKALEAQYDAATEWMEVIGHLPHSYEFELHGIVDDAFMAGYRAALLSTDKAVGELERALREISAGIFNDNGDVTSLPPLTIKRIADDALTASRASEVKCQKCDGSGVVWIAGGRCIHTGEYVDDDEKPCPECSPRASKSQGGRNE